MAAPRDHVEALSGELARGLDMLTKPNHALDQRLARDEQQAKEEGRIMKTRFTGVQVFSATMQGARDNLGERVTAWLSDNPEIEIVDTIVQQSSDNAFHCLTIVFFFNGAARKPHPVSARAA